MRVLIAVVRELLISGSARIYAVARSN